MHGISSSFLLFSSSSSIGATARCGLWPVEHCPPFFHIYHQLSPSSHSQHLKISSYFFSPSIPGSSSSSRPFQFLSEDLFGRYCKYFCNHGIYLEFQGIYRVATCLSFACHKAVCCNWWETNCPEKTLQLLHLREVYKLHRVSGT